MAATLPRTARHAVEADSLEGIAAALEELGVIDRPDEEWREVTEVLWQVHESARVATECTDGRGRQQGTVAEHAGLDDRYTAAQVGETPDVLDTFGLVGRYGRVYRVEGTR
ncbi:hypothetical protein BRD13_07770 [Halobacteriales archaeon SW_5_70_135]|nr:MAG: hypothetical protein BRD13_07770 [Halobacteriales archaeon SW_5_70_135]